MENKYFNLANDAIQLYDFQIQELSFLVEETNIFYKIITKSQKKYVLKIFQEASSTLQDNLAEAFFLSVLAERTNLVIPKLVPAKDGRNIVEVFDETEGRNKRLAVYEWVEGIDYDGNETYANFTKIGEMIATMHRATNSIEIPATIKPKKWDQVFFYQDEVAVYKEAQYQRYVDEEFIAVMDRAIPLLNERLMQLYHNTTPQLIHADLNPWNIKVHEEHIHILDFEEAMFGFPIHDISTLLYYYRDNSSLDYIRVKEAVEAGYRSILPIPLSGFDENTLDMLMAARRVNFLNYVLTIRDNPKEFIKANLPRVKVFLERYN